MKLAGGNISLTKVLRFTALYAKELKHAYKLFRPNTNLSLI